jgi:hypothetical protein
MAVMCLDGTIDFAASKIGSYWSSNVEVDVVALDEDKKIVLLGECKYHRQPVDLDVLIALKDKSGKIPELSNYSKRFVVFSKSGFTNRLIEIAAQDKNILLIDKTIPIINS